MIQSLVNDAGSALLDSGLRRNDDKEQKSLVAILMARLTLPANARLPPLPSFRRRPESSGFYNTCPHARA